MYIYSFRQCGSFERWEYSSYIEYLPIDYHVANLLLAIILVLFSSRNILISCLLFVFVTFAINS